MRPLTDTEFVPDLHHLKHHVLTYHRTQTLFTKLANYTGPSLKQLIEPRSSTSGREERYVFRVQGSRVYYVEKHLSDLALSVPRDQILSVGTCIGKFSKTGKFRMHITALDVISQHARYKIWIKPNGEMPFLYGGNILKVCPLSLLLR